MVARIVGYLSPRNVAEDIRSDGHCAANSVGALVKITDVPSDSNAKPETLGPRCEQPATILRSATIGFCGLNRAFRPIPSRTRRTASGGESGIRNLAVIENKGTPLFSTLPFLNNRSFRKGLTHELAHESGDLASFFDR
jgi:hypothetical protein